MVGLATDDMNGQEEKGTGEVAVPLDRCVCVGDQLRIRKEAGAKGFRGVVKELLLVGTWGLGR